VRARTPGVVCLCLSSGAVEAVVVGLANSPLPSWRYSPLALQKVPSVCDVDVGSFLGESSYTQ
jgi:hypothetical protein